MLFEPMSLVTFWRERRSNVAAVTLKDVEALPSPWSDMSETVR